MKLVAGKYKQPILGTLEEGSYTKLCIKDYKSMIATADKEGVERDGDSYKVGE